MKPTNWFMIFALLMGGCGDSEEEKAPQPVIAPITLRAADVSFLPDVRNSSIQFKNRTGEVRDVLAILKEAGCNTIRLRLWHSPANGASALSTVKQLAQEIKAKGFSLWLVLHYSDTWADPGQQSKPEAWKNISTTLLHDSIYAYTKKVVGILSPDIIQIGNEINSGFLWPDGNISSVSTFISLLKKGIEGAREAKAGAKIMIHFAGIDGAEWFYNTMKAQGVPYDIIGLSYYPRWHTKSLPVVKSTLEKLAADHSKEIAIAETAYPFTLGWNDYTNNIVGLNEHLIPLFPATEKGQYEFLLQLRKIISETNGGLGLAYWAPEWVAHKGNQATNGSPWENMTLFDFENKALEGIKVFVE